MDKSAKKPPLGDNLKPSLQKKGATNAAALAAFIGRSKYGKQRFQKLATKGKK